MENNSVTRQESELKSAERQNKPDFSVGYMYERTGTDFPAYYILTFGMALPRRSRVRAEVGAAAESLAAATEHVDAAQQQQLADIQKQYAAASSGYQRTVGLNSARVILIQTHGIANQSYIMKPEACAAAPATDMTAGTPNKRYLGSTVGTTTFT
jgi:hypothetical protein